MRRAIVISKKLDADAVCRVVADNVTRVNDVAFVVVVNKKIEVAWVWKSHGHLFWNQLKWSSSTLRNKNCVKTFAEVSCGDPIEPQYKISAAAIENDFRAEKHGVRDIDVLHLQYVPLIFPNQ